MDKYTSCRWFECMNRSFELPALVSCIGQYYEPYPYSCGGVSPYARKVMGECDPPQDQSDWGWFDYNYGRTDEDIMRAIDNVHGAQVYPCQ